jgi:hypothetical protein
MAICFTNQYTTSSASTNVRSIHHLANKIIFSDRLQHLLISNAKVKDMRGEEMRWGTRTHKIREDGGWEPAPRAGLFLVVAGRG